MTSQYFLQAPSTFAQYNITSSQLNALKACLLDKTLTASQTAKDLTIHPEISTTPLEMQQRVAGLWTLLNDTAVDLPSSQPKIIAILQTIRTFPRIDIPSGEGEDDFDFDDGYVWREVTGWAIDWADNFNRHGARFFLERCRSDELRVKRGEAWVSANAYTGRLAATGDVPLSSYGAGLDRASSAIVDALEFDYDHDHGPENELDRDIINASVESATQLFIHAAAELYHRCRDEYPERLWSGRGRRSGMKGLWHGGTEEEGYSEGRWGFWKERWAAISLADGQGLSSEAHAAAEEALVAMERVER